MKSRMNQIAEGKVIAPKPEIVFGEEKLKGAVLPDRTVAVEVTLTVPNRVPARLFFYSVNPRVRVTEKLTVSQSGKFQMEIESGGLSIGDEIKGSIDVVYNGGEASIPYCFTVGAEKSQKGYSFKTLSDFAAYVRESKSDAVTVFSLKEFLLLPFMQDLHLQGLYRTFASNLDPEHGMEEFLKAAGVLRDPRTAETEETAPPVTRRIVSTPEGRECKRDALLLRAFLSFEEALHKEEGVYEARLQIEKLSALYPDSVPCSLLLAYVFLQAQEMKNAKDVLLRIQDEIQKNRLDKKAEYGLFLYLASIVQGDADRVLSARKLMRKYYEENTTSLLLLMAEYRINMDPVKESRQAAEFLRQCWHRGVRYTPVLESTALLYGTTEEEPETLSEYELLSLIYGIRHGLIPERKVLLISSREITNEKFLPLYLELLKTAYRAFRNPEFLHTLLHLFLRKKMTGPRYFHWYEEGVERALQVQGLYEGYMLSLPKGRSEKLPERVVSYFTCHREADGMDVAALYANVLAYYTGQPEIFSAFRPKMAAFAVKAMKEERYSLAMIPLFRLILSKDFLNEDTAVSMLQLFSLYEAETSLPGMHRIVLYYPELDEEDTYALEGGKSALVPVYSDEAVPAVETMKGRRYHDGDIRLTRLFTDDDLEKQCMLYTGNSLLLTLRESNEIVKSGVIDERETATVTELIKNKRIAPFYRTRLYETLIDTAAKPSMENMDLASFLEEADYASFTREYRLKLLDILLRANRRTEALSRALNYGVEGLSDETLLNLTETALEKTESERDRRILAYCYTLFAHDAASTKVLDHLARYFNGLPSEMSDLLRTVRKKKVAPYDLAERVLIAGFFTGKSKELDSAFEFRLSETGRCDAAEKAYLVLRSHEYVTEKRKLSDTAVKELKKYVFSLPDVCLIALLQFFGEMPPKAGSEDGALLTKLLAKSVEKNITLACFNAFEGLAELPFELENRVFAEVRDPLAKRISVIGTVLPDQRMFHREMNEIYPGVFSQSFLLFKREWIQYSLSVTMKDDTVSEREGGVLSRTNQNANPGGRFEDLSTLEKKIASGDLKETAEYLKRLLEKEAMIGEVFR